MRLFSALFALLFAGTFSGWAQYTETINSNRPGESQGAFAVGTGVIQIESGITMGKDKHELLMTESNLYGLDYAFRYGFFKEELEISLMGSFLYDKTKMTIGATEEDFVRSNFDSNTLGAKYLVYDPYKKGEDPINIRSWKANRRFKWKTLIPAVSVYAGANFYFGDNAFMQEDEGMISPRVAVITQNNWGRWVFVMNIIGDKITEEFPTYAGIFTMTHSVNPNFSVFGEYQVIKSDIYSDNIARGGAAYLFSDNFQVDASVLFNFKDTPSRWQIGAGVSYRIDLHSEDVIREDKNVGVNKS